MSGGEEEQKKPIRTCKFYGSNFRRPRVYPSRTILIDPPEAAAPAIVEENRSESKHGAAQWTLNGLGSKRFRFHGKVEGNLNRLRMDKDDDDTIPYYKENVAPSSSKSNPIRPDANTTSSTSDFKLKPKPLVGSKRSRYASLLDDEEDDANF